MTALFKLLLPSGIHAEMVAHALRERPLECCGLLAGEMLREGAAHVRRWYPLVNAAASSREYEAAPSELLRAFKDMDARQLQLLAIYHSHPTSPARPSQTDLERSCYPDAMCLILSLRADPPEMLAWWLRDTIAVAAECHITTA